MNVPNNVSCTPDFCRRAAGVRTINDFTLKAIGEKVFNHKFYVTTDTTVINFAKQPLVIHRVECLGKVLEDHSCTTRETFSEPMLKHRYG